MRWPSCIIHSSKVESAGFFSLTSPASEDDESEGHCELTWGLFEKVSGLSVSCPNLISMSPDLALLLEQRAS